MQFLESCGGFNTQEHCILIDQRILRILHNYARNTTLYNTPESQTVIVLDSLTLCPKFAMHKA